MRPTNVSFIKCLLALAGIGVVAGDFSYPTVDQVQFRVGETHTIRFETDWEEYSIALYQQEKHENAVWQGATLIETRDGAGRKAFEWEVDTYDLSLEDSETFFFWIFQGDRSNQGDTSKSAMASPFFTVKGADDKVDGATTRTNPKSILSSSSSLFLVSKTFISEEPSATNTASGKRKKTPSTTPVQPTKASTGLGSVSPSSTSDLVAKGLAPPHSKKLPNSVSLVSPEPNDPNPGHTPSDLSVGAKAGIGVGASIGGVALIVGLAFLIAKYGKAGRSRARSVVPTSMLFWCRGRSSQSAGTPGSKAGH